jgi:hypothetical protein
VKSSKLVILSLFIFLSGCASLNSLSLTSIPTERTTPVKSQASKLIFLAFNFDNDFINSMVSDLKRQCPSGKITGLLTKDENIAYFGYFVWKKQITATGYCVGSTAAVHMRSNSRGTASELSEPTTSENGI